MQEANIAIKESVNLCRLSECSSVCTFKDVFLEPELRTSFKYIMEEPVAATQCAQQEANGGEFPKEDLLDIGSYNQELALFMVCIVMEHCEGGDMRGVLKKFDVSNASEEQSKGHTEASRLHPSWASCSDKNDKKASARQWCANIAKTHQDGSESNIIKDRIPETVIWLWLNQLAEGLQSIHQLKLIHRFLQIPPHAVRMRIPVINLDVV